MGSADSARLEKYACDNASLHPLVRLADSQCRSDISHSALKFGGRNRRARRQVEQSRTRDEIIGDHA